MKGPKRRQLRNATRQSDKRALRIDAAIPRFPDIQRGAFSDRRCGAALLQNRKAFYDAVVVSLSGQQRVITIRQRSALKRPKFAPIIAGTNGTDPNKKAVCPARRFQVIALADPTFDGRAMENAIISKPPRRNITFAFGKLLIAEGYSGRTTKIVAVSEILRPAGLTPASPHDGGSLRR